MKKKFRGTPKTLNGAIQNAFEEYKELKTVSEGRLRKLIKLHVLDFNRQKVSIVLLNVDDEESLPKSSLAALNSLAEPKKPLA
jgi:hypothetical protein